MQYRFGSYPDNSTKVTKTILITTFYGMNFTIKEIRGGFENTTFSKMPLIAKTERSMKTLLRAFLVSQRSSTQKQKSSVSYSFRDRIRGAQIETSCI